MAKDLVFTHIKLHFHLVTIPLLLKLERVNTGEIEKSHVHIIVEIIEYMPNSVVSRTIIKKITGNVTASSFDAGEELSEKSTPYDTYIQIIDGAADVVINKIEYTLKLGQGIVIPAHASHFFSAR